MPKRAKEGIHFPSLKNSGSFISTYINAQMADLRRLTRKNVTIHKIKTLDIIRVGLV
jgi:hypothetical protein